MNVGLIQKLLILGCTAVFAADGMFGYEVFQTQTKLEKWLSREKQRLSKELGETKSDRTKVPQARSYSHLREMGNLAAGVVKVKVETKPVDGPKTGPDPKDNHPALDTLIVVRGIGFPDIAFLEPTTAVEGLDITFFGKAEEIPFAPGATINRIEPEHVIFEYYEKEVALPVQQVSSKDPGAAKPGATAPGGAVAPIPVAANGVKYNEKAGRVTISRGARQTIRDRGESEVLKGVTFKPVRWTDGKPMISITGLPPSGVLAKGGVQKGDALLSINGQRMTTKAQAANYVKRNPNLPAYNVVFVRNGVKVTRTVTIK